jgi:uncharacterized protein YukE
MGEQFWVDTEGLERSGGNYDSASGQVNRVASRVNADASGFDGCWGNDSAGKQFAPGYLANKKNFVDGVTQLADVLQATADGVRIMAKNFADMEHRNTDIASKLNMKVVDDSAGGGDGGGGDAPPPEPGSTQVTGHRRMALKSTRLPAETPALLREGEVEPALPFERATEEVPAERVMGLSYESAYEPTIPATPATPAHHDQA